MSSNPYPETSKDSVGSRGQRDILVNDFGRLIYDGRSRSAALAGGVSIGLLEQAWAGVEPDDSSQLRAMVGFDHHVGLCKVVRTDRIAPDQPGWFARRGQRRWLSSVVFADEFPTTDTITLLGERVGRQSWVLRTAYCGTIAPPEPTDHKAIIGLEMEFDPVLAFWLEHAFVYVPNGQGFATEPVETTWNSVLDTI